MAEPNEPRYYENFTGTGNALNLTHPRVLQMVMDSLRYWVEIGHVDGFRFDLATTLGRGPNGFDPAAAFFAAVRQDPVLAAVKLIAEPWDIGLGGYQVGHFPPGWSEWNDHDRRTLRRYWAGEGNLIGDVGGRMTGSADLFNHDGRCPRASINHVTVHDGFTLADLVSYDHKHNEANGEDNRDGSDDNYSTNCGVEGPTDDAEIMAFAAAAAAQPARLPAAWRKASRCCSPATRSATARAATTTPIARTIRSAGWTGRSSAGRRGYDASWSAQLTALRRRFPQLRSRHWVDGRRPTVATGCCG